MKIRVVETRVYEYEPDLNASYYKDRGADTEQEIISVDMDFVKIYGMDTLEDPVEITRLWQSLNKNGDSTYEVRQVQAA